MVRARVARAGACAPGAVPARLAAAGGAAGVMGGLDASRRLAPACARAGLAVPEGLEHGRAATALAAAPAIAGHPSEEYIRQVARRLRSLPRAQRFIVRPGCVGRTAQPVTVPLPSAWGRLLAFRPAR